MFKWDILTDFQPLYYATTHFAFFENIIRSSEVGQDDLRGVYIHILEEHVEVLVWPIALDSLLLLGVCEKPICSQ